MIFRILHHLCLLHVLAGKGYVTFKDPVCTETKPTSQPPQGKSILLFVRVKVLDILHIEILIETC